MKKAYEIILDILFFFASHLYSLINSIHVLNEGKRKVRDGENENVDYQKI